MVCLLIVRQCCSSRASPCSKRRDPINHISKCTPTWPPLLLPCPQHPRNIGGHPQGDHQKHLDLHLGFKINTHFLGQGGSRKSQQVGLSGSGAGGLQRPHRELRQGPAASTQLSGWSSGSVWLLRARTPVRAGGAGVWHDHTRPHILPEGRRPVHGVRGKFSHGGRGGHLQKPVVPSLRLLLKGPPGRAGERVPSPAQRGAGISTPGPLLSPRGHHLDCT